MSRFEEKSLPVWGNVQIDPGKGVAGDQLVRELSPEVLFDKGADTTLGIPDKNDAWIKGVRSDGKFYGRYEKQVGGAGGQTSI